MIQLLSMVGGLAGEWLQGKREVSAAKQEAKISSIKATENWDQIQANNSKNSLKDEWFVGVLSLPLIGAFIPSFVPFIEEGFRVLTAMPDYYKAFLGSAIAASFGIKSLANWKNK